MIIHHSVKFTREERFFGTITKAQCSCGWTAAGDAKFVNVAAATHDLHDIEDTDERADERHAGA